MERLEKELKRLIKCIIGQELDIESDYLASYFSHFKDKEIQEYSEIIENINNSIEMAHEIGKETLEKLPGNAKLKDFLIKITELSPKYFESNPQFIPNFLNSIEKLENLSKSVNLIEFLLSMSNDDKFEQQINQRFLGELSKAEEVSKNAVKKVFHKALNTIKYKQTPSELFIKSTYQKLGIPWDTIENIKLVDFFNNIFFKEDILLKQNTEDVLDIIEEFVRRFGTSIELYLKAIFALIVNLKNISTGQKFISFNKGLGYYFNILNFSRFYVGDYLDFRNSIMHGNFIVLINQKSIKFTIRRERKGKVYLENDITLSFKEFEQKFRNFRKFQNLFFKFMENYLLENN